MKFLVPILILLVGLPAPTRAGLVIHTSVDATGGPIVLNLGEVITIDLFVSSDSMMDKLASVVLALQILESGSLASAATAPLIQEIDFSDGIFGAGAATNPAFIGAGGVQRAEDFGFTDASSSFDFTTATTPAVKFASVTFNTEHLSSTGTFQLQFEASSGGATQGTDFGVVGGTTSGMPTINNGSGSNVPITTGLTIHVVPEPGPLFLLGTVATVGCLASKRRSLAELRRM